MTSALEPVRGGRAPRLGLDALLVAWAAVASLALVGWHGAAAHPTPLVLSVLVPILVVIAVEDVRRLTIPDAANLAFGLLALGWRASLALRDGDTLGQVAATLALDLLLSGGVLWAFREIYFRLKGFDGLGLGDVKLAAASGLFLGASGFAFALLWGSLCGLLFVMGRRLLRRQSAPTSAAEPLPLGAFLAPAIFLAWILPVLAERTG